MFDPTAYENLKVILQGALYELELMGSLKVLGRKDIIDLASLERRYSLTIGRPDKENISVTVTLSAGMKEWSAEANPSADSEPGAKLQVFYQSSGGSFPDDFINKLEDWWGTGRTIELRTVNSTHQPLLHQAIVNFNRIITEEMVDDLEELVIHIENSLMEML